MGVLKRAGLVVTVVALATALAAALPGPASAHLDDHTCTGTMAADGTHNLVRVPAGGTCTVTATITAQYDVAGTLINNGTINGEVNANGGTVTNNGTINGEVKVNDGGTFTNNGTHNGELKQG
jgi:hypothetical protein